MNILRRKGSWIITLSLTALAIVYLSFLWLPGHLAIRQLQAEVDSEQRLLGKASGIMKKIAVLQQELDWTESVAAKWKKTSPRQKNLLALYEWIDSLAKNDGLRVTRFHPQPIVKYESFQEIPLSIVCSGMFSDLHGFIRHIEELPTTIRINSVKMEKKKGEAKTLDCEIGLIVISIPSTSSDDIRPTH
jgi:Tfp pilus assembly protein PilO